MVSFHEHIISELLEDENGGLVVLSSGLCLHKLVSSFLSLHSPSQGSLLILSAYPSQKSSIIVSLEQHHDSNRQNNADLDLISPSEITSDLPASQRQSLYTSGGVMFITSRILIVDLLTSKVPTSKIAGLVILNAHALSETCTEAFIVRIIRSLNRKAYIRAFSDKPHSMVAGFSKAERILKCLSVRKMHLWPRFQVHVSQELEKDPPEVVDVRVPMSSMMRGIQKAIIQVMDACLKEMRKTNKVDVEDLTVENGLFKSFDEIVRRQLDPIWHTLGKKTKQLVSDLRTLRKLLEYLVRYDAVSYLKYLDSLRASESFRSVWIFAESSYKIFEYAKKRVFYFGKSSSLASSPLGKTLTGEKRKANEVSDEKIDNEGFVDINANGALGLHEVLEEAPKWKVLREILQEIEEDIKKQNLLREEIGYIKSEDGNRLVLVACKDERSCLQIEDCILNGPRKVMWDEWESYLLSKVELRDLQKRQKKKQKEPKGVGVLDGVSPTKSVESTETTSLHKLEHDMLLRAAVKISKIGVKDPVVDDTSEPQINKRRGKKGNVKSKKKATVESKGTDSNGEPSVGEKSGVVVSEGIRVEGRLNPTTAEACVLRKHTPMIETSNLPPVHFHALESDQHVLDILKPSVIIMYHPDITFVREIEIYRAENPALKLKVYFLFYDESTEVQKFEASIRRENGAFESLIRKKSLMMMPVDQGEYFLGSNHVDEPIDVTAQNLITRRAGGRREIEKQTQVIVDMREFMSNLPNVLHQKGMRIIPVTLEVGDYVLSPLICVERKSIQDLFTSFGSGRLYHQVETMVRYYQIPVLLIEFTQDKSFSFFSASDIGDDVTPNSIISKLSLLVLHFPRLRLVWSRSLYATAEIFASLKANQDEPDDAKATRVGVPTEEGIVENDIRVKNYNASAIEFLRRLPGVTDSNYRSIMEGCNSLAELALLPVEKLTQLMGGMKVARTLRDFLDAKYPTLL